MMRLPKLLGKPVITGFCFFTTLICQGFHFKHYSIDQGLPSSEVYHVMQDELGYLWFATDRGVCRYDGHEFKVFTRKDGLPDDVVFSFYVDDLQRMWFYTYTGGIGYFENGQIVVPDFNAAFIKALHADLYPVISSMHIDSAGNIWVGTFENILYVIEPSGVIKTYDNSRSACKLCTRIIDFHNENPRGFVYSDHDDKYTFDHEAISVSFIDVSGKESIIDFPELDVQYYVDSRFLRNDSSSFYYAYDNWVFLIDKQGVLQSHELQGVVLDCLRKDSKGNLWVGTRKGIYCFADADLNTEPTRYLSEHQVSSFCQDLEGAYWFTTADDGIFYLPNLELQSLRASAFGALKIVSLGKNEHGLYASSSNGAMAFLPDGKPEQLTALPHGSAAGIKVHYLGREVAYIKNSAQLLTHNGHTSTELGFKPDFYNRNDYNQPYTWSWQRKKLVIHDLEKDSTFSFDNIAQPPICLTVLPGSKELWYGTFYGVYYIKDQKPVWLGQAFSELGFRVSDIDVLDDQHLAVSTRGNGLWIINTHTHSIKKIEAVTNNHCNATKVDREGNLWVATFSGLYKIQAPLSQDPQVYCYTTFDGLLSNQVNDVLEYDGKIWVATSKGLSYFNWDWSPPKINLSSTRIVGISINDHDTTVLDAYTLPYYQNNITVTNRALTYRAPYAYRYKMSGLSENWINSTDGKIRFTQLKPGRYVLHIGAAENTLKPVPIQKVVFDIEPPFWKSLWFYLVLGVILIILTVVVLRIRFRVVSRQDFLYNLFLKSERKALRAQISPHFLFNALNAILNLTISDKKESSTKYTMNLAALMRSVLENSRKDEISVAEEVKFLSNYLDIERERYDNRFTYTIELSPAIKVEKTNIPSMFIQPYVENAVKHGIGSRDDKQGRIRIGFFQHKGRLSVEISDNGVGFKQTKRHLEREHTSLGMKINAERLNLFDDSDHYHVKITDANRSINSRYKGAKVIITFPLKLADDQ